MTDNSGLGNRDSCAAEAPGMRSCRTRSTRGSALAGGGGEGGACPRCTARMHARHHEALMSFSIADRVGRRRGKDWGIMSRSRGLAHAADYRIAYQCQARHAGSGTSTGLGCPGRDHQQPRACCWARSHRTCTPQEMHRHARERAQSGQGWWVGGGGGGGGGGG